MANYRSMSSAGSFIFNVYYSIILTLYSVPVCILCRAKFYHVLVAKYCDLGCWFSVCDVVRRKDYRQRNRELYLYPYYGRYLIQTTGSIRTGNGSSERKRRNG